MLEGEHITCDRHSAVVRTTRFSAEGTAPKGNVHFSGDIITAGGSSALGQALIFVILDYITNHAGELYLLEQTSSRDGES